MLNANLYLTYFHKYKRGWQIYERNSKFINIISKRPYAIIVVLVKIGRMKNYNDLHGRYIPLKLNELKLIELKNRHNQIPYLNH